MKPHDQDPPKPETTYEPPAIVYSEPIEGRAASCSKADPACLGGPDPVINS